jgi:hypothetical protein
MIWWSSRHCRLLNLSVEGIIKELINDLAWLYRDSLIIEGNRESTDNLVKQICTEACIECFDYIGSYTSCVMTLDSDLYWKGNPDIPREDRVWRWRDNIPVDI